MAPAGERTDGGWIGRPLKRREDRRLLTGSGRYVDDIRPPGCAHVVLLRSPHAHARIVGIDVERARGAPGVLGVVTGAEVSHLAPMPVNRLVPDMRMPPHPIIAATRVHAAGTPVAGVALEPRAVLAAFDASTEELTLWVSCQAPFRIRAEVARLLELPESRVRVIAPDVGGGFGVKSGPYREDVLLAWLARRLGRPVKWVATRSEDQITT